MSNSSEYMYNFQVLLLPPMYGVQMCVALLGNVFALWLLATKERQNWHSGVVFSCNLAICDILYVLTLPLLIIYYAKNKNWSFGDAACKIERFLFNCNLYASIFFIMCISVNRFVAIVYPFFTRSYVLPKHAKIASVLTWSIVIVASSPVFKFAGIELKANHTLCVSCHDESLQNSHFKYKLSLMVVGCLIPMVVTFGSYLGVIWTILKNKNITALEKRKVALLVSLVCILYATSFVPYHVLQTYHEYLKSVKRTKLLVYNSYQVSKGLTTLNMCLHPLLYMAVFDSIRTTCCGRSSDD
ncbi:P2Y purinoceptor 11 isoform X2 [Pimephales promelas]|nr:P2Y purinoceptor 11 isoform X2 [Pimephales promelas]